MSQNGKNKQKRSQRNLSAEEKLSPVSVACQYEDGMAESPGNEDSETNRRDIYGRLESIENSIEQILSENVKLRSEFQEMKASHDEF